MLKFVLIFSGGCLLALSDVFFGALRPPFNLINLFNIVLMLIFFYWSIESCLTSALFLGLMADILHNDYLGVTILIYLPGLLIIYLIRNSILTSESKFSHFVIILIFNFYYLLINLFRHFSMNWLVIQESLIILLQNSIITILGFIIIQRLIKKFHAKFI